MRKGHIGLLAGILIVVARDRLELIPELRQEFGGPGVDVVPDRRRGDRRSRSVTSTERRHDQRRVRVLDPDLHNLGFAIIFTSDPGTGFPRPRRTKY